MQYLESKFALLFNNARRPVVVFSNDPTMMCAVRWGLDSEEFVSHVDKTSPTPASRRDAAGNLEPHAS